MAQTFGLTLAGFVAMQQQDVVDDLESSLKTSFGSNLNFAPESNLGQLVAITSRALTLVWQLGEAVAAGQTVSGAEGTSVDNVLALNNLRRLTPKATVTQPDFVLQTNGLYLYGLVVYGVPGTSVAITSLIGNGASPETQFGIDATTVITAPVKCLQSVFFSDVPDSGAYELTFTEGPKIAGNVFGGTVGEALTTSAIPYNALTTQAQLAFSANPTSGTFTLTLTAAGAPLVTAAINYNDTAATIQTAVRALSGYSAVTVVGSISGGLTFTWGSICHPLLTVTDNSLSNGSPVTGSVIDSVQADVNNLYDSVNAIYPFTDVTTQGFTVGVNFTFGGLATPVGSNPGSGNQPQPLVVVASNTLMKSSTVVNMNAVITAQGQGTGDANVGVTPVSATCTQTGPIFVAAGSIINIDTPISGWNGVYNQLDCVSGQNTENDTQAMVRRSQLLAAQANGPLQAIVEKVTKVSGVTAAIGFQNLTNAANQLLDFASVPVSGAFKLRVDGVLTGSLAYNATAGDIQTAVNAVSGYSAVTCAGTFQFGFEFVMNGANGAQAVPLFTVESNTTGVVATTSFGRPAHSFEVVVQGGADSDVATTIYGSMPAGIDSYGSTTTQILDKFGNPTNISFSRPTEVPIYVTISLVTDTFNIPGNSGSGVNPKAKFTPQSVAAIQSDILSIGGLVTIGGTVIGFGSEGLIGAFNAVPGIVSYTLYFGIGPNPSTNTNVAMLAEQVPLFETFNTIVAFV